MLTVHQVRHRPLSGAASAISPFIIVEQRAPSSLVTGVSTAFAPGALVRPQLFPGDEDRSSGAIPTGLIVWMSSTSAGILWSGDVSRWLGTPPTGPYPYAAGDLLT